MAKQESNCEGSSVVSDLINFLNVSPTAFHAVGNFTLSVFVSRSKSRFPSLTGQILNRFCWSEFEIRALDLNLLYLLWFCIADEAKKRLRSAGYAQVSEREDWKLEAGKKYFFTRNYSTIVAFAIGKK